MPIDTATATPARSLGAVGDAGYRLLRDVQSEYRDGGEQRVLEIIRAAHNVHSTSDELIVSATTWAERYHLNPSRANVLRAIDLPADARVLEIGAGCGAITRYLGETCAVVDALEPVPARAAAAAARTRDCAGVEVMVGMLEDVPPVATYDVIVVVGVLEYLGAGTSEREPYHDFLDQVSARLVDGGTLVLAIENRLGVKYLVGAPEDHTGRFFDSVEGYPVGGKARTFTRLELETMLRRSALEPSTLIAFPDYKLTRTVMAHMPAGAESLLYRIPRLPSPDWTRKRPRLADEGRVWRSLVEGGLGTDFGNSFLILAGKGGPSALWPDGRIAAFYSTNRRPALNTQTLVTTGEQGVQFERRGLVDGPHQVGTIRLVESIAPYEDGRDLLEIVAEGGLDAAGPLIADWLSLLRDRSHGTGAVSMDLVPHNLVVDGSGGIHVIDIELIDDELDAEAVVRRGIYWLAERVTRIAPAQRWSPHRTVGEVMLALGAFAGLPQDGSWVEQAVHGEVEVAVQVRPGPPTGTTMQQWRAQLESDFGKIPQRKLAGLAVGERLWETHQRKVAAFAETAKRKDAQVTKLERDLARTRSDLEKTRRQLSSTAAKLQKVRSQTMKARARRRLAAWLPAGTRRREVAVRTYRRLR